LRWQSRQIEAPFTPHFHTAAFIRTIFAALASIWKRLKSAGRSEAVAKYSGLVSGQEKAPPGGRGLDNGHPQAALLTGVYAGAGSSQYSANLLIILLVSIIRLPA